MCIRDGSIRSNYFSTEANRMKLNRFHISFKTIVSEAKSELKSRVLSLSADRGYYVDNLTLFFEDTGFMPGVRVSLQPTLNYDVHALSELETALETDINNIVFNYIYNSRHKILSLIHISEPTRLGMISYAVFCLKKKKQNI